MSEIKRKINVPRGLVRWVEMETTFSNRAVGIALGKYQAAPNSVSDSNTELIIKKAVEIAKERIAELQEFIDAFSH